MMHKRTWALALGLTLFGACTESTRVPDLNNVASSTISGGLNKSLVQLLATGLANQDRASLDVRFLVFTNTMARDVFRIDPAEGRFITEMVGVAADPTAFTGGGVWTQFFSGIRAANTIIDNVATASDLTTAEQAATKGWAKTIAAVL